ncbi:uncharacterized protein RCO7_09723 [Rhynchosporium graminicola]|uniref:Uncharacterized protein n=1 Tax=Rhynchosporium graminicola TaxID=2792576 RepID=A0A1E1LBW1_9HELO|nr:uncharacterized protein RCO7_09723 [Rhynchosporium commune]
MGIITRKFEPSISTSEDYDKVTGVCSIEFFSSRDVEDFFQDEIEQILGKYEISQYAIDLKRHSPKHTSVGAQDTLVIYTHNEFITHWKEATTEIQGAVHRCVEVQGVEAQIQVEIRHKDKVYRDWSFALRPDRPELAALEIAQDCVHAELKSLKIYQNGVLSALVCEAEIGKTLKTNQLSYFASYRAREKIGKASRSVWSKN